MTAPIHASTLKISHESEDELDRKLIAIMQKRGFVVTRSPYVGEEMTVGQLARALGRPVPTVTCALRRRGCPEFFAERGKSGRIRWLRVHQDLRDFISLIPAKPQQRKAKA